MFTLLSLILTLLCPPLLPAVVSIGFDGTYAYSFVDPVSAATAGSANRDTFTSTTESMIKPWIAADYLRRTKQPSPARLAQVTAMLRDSDDNAAEQIYLLGGGTPVVTRMVDTCGLRNTTARPGWWSLTRTTAGDTVRLGACLRDGRAAGSHTPWLLEQMRAVRGEGRFGVVEALPARVAAVTSTKNGWTQHGGTWHVNCLAVHPRFTLAVLTRYPVARGLHYGAQACTRITEALLVHRWTPA